MKLPFAVGDTSRGIGRIERILSGGMGAVFIAERADDARADRALGFSPEFPRRVAVKTVSPKAFYQPESRRQFDRECLLWTTLLPHPHIVRAFSVTKVGLWPCLILEYVDGGNLRERLHGGPLPLAEALRLSLQFCSGMEFLKQAANIVHRDIKPENVLLTREGIVKIADFGLARAFQVKEVGREEARRASDADLVGTGASRPGVIAGTFAYMSPEQLLAAPVDTRSDIYAFGIMLFEMLTGQRPFAAKSGAEFRRQHLYQRPAAPDEIAQVPRDISRVVMKCLEKKPDDRFADFSEFRSVLEAHCRTNGLEHIMPPTVSLADLKASMSAMDWQLRALSLSTLSKECEADGRKDLAREYIQRCHEHALEAYKLDPDAPGSHGTLGQTLVDLNRQREALPHLEREVQLYPSPPARYNLAACLLALYRPIEAIAQARLIPVADPDNPTWWQKLAEASATLSLETERAEAIRQAIAAVVRTSHTRDDADLVITGIVAGQSGDVRSAMELHAFAVRHRPDSALAWHALGVTLHRYGHFDFAEQCYDFSIRADGTMTVSRFNRAHVLAAMGRLGDARADWMAVMAAGPGDFHDRAKALLEASTTKPDTVVSVTRSPSALRNIPYET